MDAEELDLINVKIPLIGDFFDKKNPSYFRGVSWVMWARSPSRYHGAASDTQCKSCYHYDFMCHDADGD